MFRFGGAQERVLESEEDQRASGKRGSHSFHEFQCFSFRHFPSALGVHAGPHQAFVVAVRPVPGGLPPGEVPVKPVDVDPS